MMIYLYKKSVYMSFVTILNIWRNYYNFAARCCDLWLWQIAFNICASSFIFILKFILILVIWEGWYVLKFTKRIIDKLSKSQEGGDESWQLLFYVGLYYPIT